MNKLNEDAIRVLKRDADGHFAANQCGQGSAWDIMMYHAEKDAIAALERQTEQPCGVWCKFAESLRKHGGDWVMSCHNDRVMCSEVYAGTPCKVGELLMTMCEACDTVVDDGAGGAMRCPYA